MRLLRQAGDGCWHMNGSTKKIHDRNGVHVGSTTALTYLHGSNKKKTKWVMHEYRVDHSLYGKSIPQATELVLCCIQESGRGEEINNYNNNSSNRIINNSHHIITANENQVIKVPKPHMNMTMSRKRQKGPANNNEGCANLNNYNNNSNIDGADGVPTEMRSRTNYTGCCHAEEEEEASAAKLDDRMMASFDSYCYTSQPMPMPTTETEVYVNSIEEIMGTQQATAVSFTDILTNSDDDSFAQELEDILLQSDTTTTPDLVLAAATATDHAEPGTVNTENYDHVNMSTEGIDRNIITDQANPATVDASSAVNEFNSDDIPCFSIESIDEFLSPYHGEELQQLQNYSDVLNMKLDQWFATLDFPE